MGSAVAPAFAVLGVVRLVLSTGAVLDPRAARRVAREPRTGG
ncbi:hypothetical protein [Nocardiopsis aegyptia]|uniref:Uncharacterized protein n=1 Tax=Nocardiopsis aegyptia TaxID=220378 RepID=A0A7Z0EJ04_9ACTN|nr:hypothetical protein [Nocardiopsis aegyptia]NYJ32891.1 hypothetical protein [Nocardiopsis aegyptia]